MSEPPILDPPYIYDVDEPVNAKQRSIVFKYAFNRGWITLDQAERDTGILSRSVGSRLRDLRIPKYGGYIVDRERMHTEKGMPRIFRYRLRAPLPAGEGEQNELFGS